MSRTSKIKLASFFSAELVSKGVLATHPEGFWKTPRVRIANKTQISRVGRCGVHRWGVRVRCSRCKS